MNIWEMLGIFLVTGAAVAFVFVIPYSIKDLRDKMMTSVKTGVAAGMGSGFILWGLLLLTGSPFVLGLYGTIVLSAVIGMIGSYLVSGGRFTGRVSRSAAVRVMVLVVIIVAMVVGVSFEGAIHNAYSFNNALTFESGSALFANDTLPYDKIPVIGQQYASYIASSHLGDFGGNAKIYDSELIVENSTPYWIFSVGPKNTFSNNYLLGFETVNAVNATFKEILQKTMLGAGLFFTHQVNFHTYLGHTNYMIGNHYPQLRANGQVDYVVTLNTYGANGLIQPAGGIAYNPDGVQIAQWSSAATAPSWVNQPWDKNIFGILIHDWADNRKSNSSFGFFAGGFAGLTTASQFMMNVDNNSELIPYHNGTAYMQFLSPANARNALSGVMLITGDHYYFYNLEKMGLISASAAKATIQAKLPALSGAQYFTSNPVLYPVGKYFAWIVPYYSEEASTGIVQLQGIGIVDAENSAHFVAVQSTFSTVSSTGISTLVNNAIGKFLGSTVTPTGTTTTVSGTVVNNTHFDVNGTTYDYLELNNSQYYVGSASSLSGLQMAQLLLMQVGTNVTLQVQGTQIVSFTVGKS